MRLKELRIEHKLTQAALAKELNVAANTLCNWENGKRTPDAETLKRIADYFGVGVDYLLGESNLNSSKQPPKITPKHVKAFFSHREQMIEELENCTATFRVIALSHKLGEPDAIYNMNDDDLLTLISDNYDSLDVFEKRALNSAISSFLNNFLNGIFGDSNNQ